MIEYISPAKAHREQNVQVYIGLPSFFEICKQVKLSELFIATLVNMLTIAAMLLTVCKRMDRWFMVEVLRHFKHANNGCIMTEIVQQFTKD